MYFRMNLLTKAYLFAYYIYHICYNFSSGPRYMFCRLDQRYSVERCEKKKKDSKNDTGTIQGPVPHLLSNVSDNTRCVACLTRIPGHSSSFSEDPIFQTKNSSAFF